MENRKPLLIGLSARETIVYETTAIYNNKAYIDFLKSGASDHPVELLKIAGVDMGSPEPVKLAMDTFKDLVKEFEKLML